MSISRIILLLIGSLLPLSAKAESKTSISRVIVDGRNVIPSDNRPEWVLPHISNTLSITVSQSISDSESGAGFRIMALLSGENVSPCLDSSGVPAQCVQGLVLTDNHGNELTNNFLHLGAESQQWHGEIFNSKYEKHRVAFLPPSNRPQVKLRFVLSTGRQSPEIVGLMAMRRCVLTLLPNDPKSPPIVINLMDDDNLTNSVKWTAGGSKPAMASLHSFPHADTKALVIKDTSITKGADWISPPVSLNGIKSVTAEWETAYSIGLGSGTFNFRKPSDKLEPGFHDLQIFLLKPNGRRRNPSLPGVLTTIPVYISPPFYRTTTFTISVATAFLLMPVVLYHNMARARMQKHLRLLEKREAVELERTRIARDLHDNLGADLTQLAMLSDLLQHESPEEIKSNQKLEQIFELAEDMTRQVDEIVWTVNPEHDTLPDFIDFATSYVRHYLATAGLRCRISTPVTIPDEHISSPRRHHLLMVMKEAVHNIVKHAHATEVVISVLIDDHIKISIQDNGSGMPDAVQLGDGLRNMRERMTLSQGAFDVTSVAGQGTAVTISLSLKE